MLDFATTNDITGGSSGSPVVDAKGEIVGTAFDGNIHGIAGDFAYDAAAEPHDRRLHRGDQRGAAEGLRRHRRWRGN